MKFEDILKACSSGTMPRIIASKEDKHFPARSIGLVTTIKANGKHQGVGVSFPGIGWEIWFNESDDVDRRTRYVRDIELYHES